MWLVIYLILFVGAAVLLVALNNRYTKKKIRNREEEFESWALKHGYHYKTFLNKNRDYYDQVMRAIWGKANNKNFFLFFEKAEGIYGETFTLDGSGTPGRIVLNGKYYKYSEDKEKLERLILGEEIISEFKLASYPKPAQNYSILLAMMAYLDNDTEPDFNLCDVITKSALNSKKVVLKKNTLLLQFLKNGTGPITKELIDEIKQMSECQNEITIGKVLMVAQKIFAEQKG